MYQWQVIYHSKYCNTFRALIIFADTFTEVAEKISQYEDIISVTRILTYE